MLNLHGSCYSSVISVNTGVVVDSDGTLAVALSNFLLLVGLISLISACSLFLLFIFVFFLMVITIKCGTTVPDTQKCL